MIRPPHRALAASLAANGVFAAIVLSGPWGAFQALLLLWIETLVVGVYGIAGILATALLGNPLGRLGRFRSRAGALLWTSALVVWFTIQFGAFLLIPGFAVLVLPAVLAPGEGATVEALRASLPGVAMGTVALFASHGVAFVTEFLRRREYASASVARLLSAPYVRALHLLGTLVVALGLALLGPGVSRASAFAGAVVGIKLLAELALRWPRPSGRPASNQPPRAPGPARSHPGLPG